MDAEESVDKRYMNEATGGIVTPCGILLFAGVLSGVYTMCVVHVRRIQVIRRTCTTYMYAVHV